MLHILFTAFPGGRQGVALFILRAALGVTVLKHGAVDSADPAWCGIAMATCGVLLTIGFLTPIVAILVGLVTLSPTPVCAALFQQTVPFVLVAAILAATVLLGPGAFSIDARLFGRREIIIPLPPSHE